LPSSLEEKGVKKEGFKKKKVKKKKKKNVKKKARVGGSLVKCGSGAMPPNMKGKEDVREEKKNVSASGHGSRKNRPRFQEKPTSERLWERRE